MRTQGGQTSPSLAQGVRAANDQIALQAERHNVRFGVPMLCECGDPGCSELFLVSLDGYRQARQESAFLIAPSHRG